ncbi:putative protein phosphatase 2C 51 isoform X4 [Cucumis melo var. makuwa]|uniref:Uncharacterized protein n=1 Tax=Cucumis melo var. makuwa TaxID=1194695 RepID=A0A5D3E2U8_CUCMM|nr:putative protein phosphatase 2C 51 isoform X4 [Cucumis melo var. makuwa]TYK30099.1 putative protein phosphatase 2C 51 isoform X4 [Cucumis melo var. makuwa]
MILLRIIDFGSAIDEFTVKHLYGSMGPSRAEQTYDYTPPEALLNSSWYQEMSGPVLQNIGFVGTLKLRQVSIYRSEQLLLLIEQSNLHLSFVILTSSVRPGAFSSTFFDILSFPHIQMEVNIYFHKNGKDESGVTGLTKFRASSGWV